MPCWPKASCKTPPNGKPQLSQLHESPRRIVRRGLFVQSVCRTAVGLASAQQGISTRQRWAKAHPTPCSPYALVPARCCQPAPGSVSELELVGWASPQQGISARQRWAKAHPTPYSPYALVPARCCQPAPGSVSELELVGWASPQQGISTRQRWAKAHPTPCSPYALVPARCCQPAPGSGFET